jgi:hypothetical protein
MMCERQRRRQVQRQIETERWRKGNGTEMEYRMLDAKQKRKDEEKNYRR